jgi:hypothetical protein
MAGKRKRISAPSTATCSSSRTTRSSARTTAPAAAADEDAIGQTNSATPSNSARIGQEGPKRGEDLEGDSEDDNVSENSVSVGDGSDAPAYDTVTAEDKAAFGKLLDEHYLMSKVRQAGFGELLDGTSWGVEIGAGTCTFGADKVYKLQLVGSYSAFDSSWMWAWNNSASEFPSAVLTEVTKLRELGGLFNKGCFTIDSQEHAYSFAMVASGLAGNVPYYRGPYPGGCLFFLVMGDEPQKAARKKLDPLAIMTKISECATASHIITSHKSALNHFLRAQGFSVSIEIGSDGENDEMVAMRKPTKSSKQKRRDVIKVQFCDKNGLRIKDFASNLLLK